MYKHIGLRFIVFFFTIFFLSIFCFSEIATAGTFYAFSMSEAKERLVNFQSSQNELTTLGDITRLAGIVYDERTDDLIIIGQKNNREKPIPLDDFVVALRAVLKLKEYPYVSIDKTENTDKAGKLKVNFKGGIKDTKFGKELLQADITLKQLSLGKIPSQVWGVESYFSMAVDHLKDNNEGNNKNRIGSRFWFYPQSISLGLRHGVGAIREAVLGLETRVDYAIINGKKVYDVTSVRDEIGDEFVRQVMSNFSDLSTAYPPLARLRVILNLTAVAKAIKKLKHIPDLSYWLDDYEVQEFDTKEYFPIIKRKKKVEANGSIYELNLNGGIELNPLVLRLKAGDVTALREAVLKSRPQNHSITWNVPIKDWHIPGFPEESIESSKKGNELGTRKGFSLDRAINDASHDYASMNMFERPLTVSPSSLPKISTFSNLKPQVQSPSVGGVMLQGAARISGAEDARVNLAGGNFSLIVDGKNARLAPEVFRKFVTALWSTYYSNQDPGISIDPIAPGAKKHLVRYIGKVINTDLGRVMREADYLMKKWAVGTERPDIPGFMNPDDIAASRGVMNIGAWSRFWFVPEDMRFKRGDNTLLFDDGRMTVKTEYMFKNEGMSADPANERFAEFFTSHYNGIAQRYPVYKELFEYAKMVSLANYLKENGIPLYWFLMANKDLVITEDSPGTVDALAKGSDYFRGVHIEGGVDLSSQGNYVYDEQAVNAINKAISKIPASSFSRTSLATGENRKTTGAESFSFDLGKGSYTVVPQHSLTSGKDRRGIRYQTDLALKATGFRLTEQSLRDLKSEIFYREFSKQLRQALPSVSDQDVNNKEEYEVLYKEIGKKAKREVDDILRKMEGLANQEYKTEHEFTEAVEDKIGREQAAKLKPFIIKHAYYKANLELVRYFNPRQQDSGEFGKGWHLLIPYRIKPAGNAKTDFLNARIPEKMALENLLTGKQEILTFSTDRYSIAGYVPEKLESSQVVGLFMLSDASYRLADKLGNEFCFNQAGYLTDMIFSEYHRFHLEYLNGFTDAFEKIPYQVQPAGREMIDFLNVSIPKRMKVRDLIHGSSEALTFSDKGRIAGYVPENAENSRFKILALMSDASFRLVDKEGNEIAFSPSGDFDKMAFSPEHPVVSSVTQGKYKVNFKYTIDDSGKIMIAGAYLSRGEKGAKPTYVVHYQYDDEGRLCRVAGYSNQAARNPHQQEKRLATRK